MPLVRVSKLRGLNRGLRQFTSGHDYMNSQLAECRSVLAMVYLKTYSQKFGEDLRKRVISQMEQQCIEQRADIDRVVKSMEYDLQGVDGDLRDRLVDDINCLKQIRKFSENKLYDQFKDPDMYKMFWDL